MNSHPYLRAYMAGVTVPTAFLLVVMTVFTIARFVYNISIPVERAIAFPMAVVPNLWGLWNMLYLALHSQRWPIGMHGAILPALLIPAGLGLANLLGVEVIRWTLVSIGAPIGFIAYYLAWKYLVGYFNRMLGIA